jgi:hypothetical protein
MTQPSSCIEDGILKRNKLVTVVQNAFCNASGTLHHNICTRFGIVANVFYNLGSLFNFTKNSWFREACTTTT